MKRTKKTALTIMICLLVFLIIAVTAVAIINIFVKVNGRKNILSLDMAIESDGFQCIVVLGCGVKPDGKPSPMLSDRLDTAISLYKNGVAPKLLMSGDHRSDNYDEVNTMKQYAIEHGVLSKDIFMDHAGLSTYDSIYRAKDIFCLDKIIVVTQKYHLYRALYLANSFDITAYGVLADLRKYSGQKIRDAREILARNKDFLMSIVKPLPTILGDQIPVVNQNGDITNDK